MQVLDRVVWEERARAHRERVDVRVGPHLARRARGERHPVEDFLFTYYSNSVTKLRGWHPGAGVVLRDAGPERYGGPDYRAAPGGVVLDTAAVVARRGERLGRILRLLEGTASRPAHFGCFGMHEWAMVYRTSDIRHAAHPLRLPPGEIAATVDGRGVRCSHFDAFRFFTPAARPLNTLQPTRADQADLEQPGCLHANMDLYKWAYTLSPLVPGELVADCFELAADVRAVDMRASPYDLADLGYPPIRVETAEGRSEYVVIQRAFAERAAVLRDRLRVAVAALVGEPVSG